MNKLIEAYEVALHNLNVVEASEGKIPAIRYSRMLSAAVRQCESAQDAIFDGRE